VKRVKGVVHPKMNTEHINYKTMQELMEHTLLFKVWGFAKEIYSARIFYILVSIPLSTSTYSVAASA